jgi:ketosteroid isomerase-like protein
MFAAFGDADLDALIATVHPESRWVYYGANPRISQAVLNGRVDVRRFFARILERLDMTAFEPREFLVDGDAVIIFGSETGTVRSTRQPFHNEWVQKYVVEEGLITSMVEYNIQVEPRS